MKRAIIAAIVVISASANHLWAAGSDLQKLLQDTQRLEQGKDSFRLVWWIPTEYWKASFKHVGNLSDTQKKEFYNAVDNYVVFCVVDAKIGNFGSMAPSSREEIIGKLSLAIGQEEKMKPLSDAEVSADARNLFAAMKPIMANTLGQFGRGMEFVCFQGVNSKGMKRLDPKREGSFTVDLGGATYKWRLPLGSVLAPKYDPQTDEEFPGNYSYNPFTGRKLESKTPPTK